MALASLVAAVALIGASIAADQAFPTAAAAAGQESSSASGPVVAFVEQGDIEAAWAIGFVVIVAAFE